MSWIDGPRPLTDGRSWLTRLLFGSLCLHCLEDCDITECPCRDCRKRCKRPNVKLPKMKVIL